MGIFFVVIRMEKSFFISIFYVIISGGFSDKTFVVFPFAVVVFCRADVCRYIYSSSISNMESSFRIQYKGGWEVEGKRDR